MKNSSFALLFLVGFIWLIPQETRAQSISLTSPTSSSQVTTGSDFATDLLGNSWDFSDVGDMGWTENFTNDPSDGFSGGIWSGTNQVAGGYVFPLFPGFKGSVFHINTPGDKSLANLGIKNPIPASKYTRLCYRLNHSARSLYAIYWSYDASQPEYWPDGSNKGANADEFYPPTSSTGVQNTGFNIYCHDMTNLAGSFQQTAGSWTGNIHALRIDPSVSGGVGGVTQLDWVRLVDPNSAPNITVSWNSSGLSNAWVIDVMVDTNNSGNDGDPITHIVSSGTSGSYTIPTASFPPGDYYFYLRARKYAAAGFTGQEINSGYSARLRITNAPTGGFTSPSFNSGEEYFSTVATNAADMDGTADVRNLDTTSFLPVNRQFSNPQFIASSDAEDGGLFAASADAPLPGNTESDVQVHLNVNQTRPIDPQKFRYAAYRMGADPTNFPTIDDKVRRGWVTRFVWWNNDVIADGGDPGANVLYKGMHEYNFDLASLSMERGFPWSSYSHLRNLRLDPLEVPIATWFYLDWVRLYAENRTSDGLFTISFNIADADSSSFTVQLFYDSDRSGFDGAPITTLSGLSAGNHSFVWNTAGLPDGASYYIYAVVSDGSNTSRFYSPVHVKIGDYVPQPVPRTGGAFADYDGDGFSDLFQKVSSSATRVCSKWKDRAHTRCKKYKTILAANISQVLSTNTGIVGKNQHEAASVGVGLDFTGDKYADLTTYLNGVWFILESRTATRRVIPFGTPGDIPVPGDYDGDGKDDLAIWRPTTAEWWVRTASGGVTSFVFGQSGDLPIPRDFDGDGSTDYAVYRPSTGTWWIYFSGYTTGYSNQQMTSVSWGLADDFLVPADYDGDGIDELAVYRPSDGNWYIYNLRTSATSIVSWGLAGLDQPHSRLDLNRDGKADFVVFRPSTLTWYANLGGGVTRTYNFGNADGQPLANH